MGLYHVKGISIKGIGSAVPKGSLDATAFVRMFDEKSVRKFRKYSGVSSIRCSSKGQTASDLGYEAAEQLLSELKINRADIGTLCFVSLSPDYRRPPTSCVLQMRLGLSENCAAIDITHGCAGFIYGHQVMLSLMSASDMRYGLLILGETSSKLVSPNDRSSMLFGDGGAAVLYCNDTCEDNNCLLYTDGSGFKDIIVPGGGFRNEGLSTDEYVCSDGVIRTINNLHMNGTNVYHFATTRVPEAIRCYLEKTKTDINQYDRFFIHPANKSIFDVIVSELGVDKEKCPSCLEEYGNTSCSSIPLSMCEYYKDRNVKERILACGFGVGLSWGVTSFAIDARGVLSVIETDNSFEDMYREMY